MPTQRNAFSLIELLVVISIIAVLAALLLPAIGLAKASSQTANCASNMRQFGIAFTAYLADNDQVWPDGAWNWRIQDYVNENGQISSTVPAVYKMGHCPSLPETTHANSPLNAGYAYTGVYWNSLGSGPNGYFFAWQLVANPPKIVMGRMVRIAEKCFLNEMWDDSNYSATQANWGKSQLNDQSTMRVHRQGANFLCVDGHVQFLPVDSSGPFRYKQWGGDAMWTPYSSSASVRMK